MHTEMGTISEEDQQAAETSAYLPARHRKNLVRRGVLEHLRGRESKSSVSQAAASLPHTHGSIANYPRHSLPGKLITALAVLASSVGRLCLKSSAFKRWLPDYEPIK